MQLADRPPLVSERLRGLLRAVVEARGSDLFLYADTAPCAKIHGHHQPLDLPTVGEQEVAELSLGLLTGEQRRHLEVRRKVRVAFNVPGLARFRADVFAPKGMLASIFRPIPFELPTFEAQHLPPEVAQIAELSHGLALFMGPRSSGLSTTIAAVLERLSTQRQANAVDLEVPVEHPHRIKRQLPTPAESQSDAEALLRLREIISSDSACIVLLGDTSGPAKVSLGLELAEAGHLVLGTVTAGSISDGLTRVLTGFDDVAERKMRGRLATAIRAVMYQCLLPAADADGCVPAIELALPGRRGEVALNQSLAAHYRAGRIGLATALKSSPDPDELQSFLNPGG